MPDLPLLGCPHCGKPVAFAPDLAGKLASCPHCRGAFQMPSTPPTPSKPLASPATPAPKRSGAELAFDPDAPLSPSASGQRHRNEPTYYGNAVQMSLVAAVTGTILALALGAIIFMEFALTRFPQPGVQTFILAILWSLAAVMVAVGGIAAAWLVRHLVLVFVEYARIRTGAVGRGSGGK